MIRLNIVVEGQTEETFVRDVLSDHLAMHNVVAVARCVETGRKHGKVYRGGLFNYAKARRDILCWMKEDSSLDTRFTTMFDLYHLPKTFPGYGKAVAKSDVYRRVELLENFMEEDIADERKRFIPYIQLHEFEAILFVEPQSFATQFPNKKGKVR